MDQFEQNQQIIAVEEEPQAFENKLNIRTEEAYNNSNPTDLDVNNLIVESLHCDQLNGRDIVDRETMKTMTAAENSLNEIPSVAAKQRNSIAMQAKPKGRQTAYTIFLQYCRNEQKEKRPNERIIFGEFSRKCAEKWRKTTEKEKKKFRDMAEKDKQRYELETDYYNSESTRLKQRKRRRNKDPNAPKHGISSFFWFCHEERDKVRALNPQLGLGAVAKELGRQWSLMNVEQKRIYEAKAERDKERYHREILEYNLYGKMPNTEPTKIFAKETKKKSTDVVTEAHEEEQQQQHEEEQQQQQQHEEEQQQQHEDKVEIDEVEDDDADAERFCIVIDDFEFEDLNNNNAI